MSRVTLVHPSNEFLSTPTMYFSLGLLYIAAVLEKAGHVVKIVDLRKDYHPIPEADFYGITATTSMEITHAKQISRYLKKRYPNAVRILGGHHALYFPEECIKDFDVVVVGEGEKAVLEVVDEGARGIVQGGITRNLDAVPFPARHLLPEESVFSNALFEGEKYGKGPKATTLITSRGCPYQCAFCPQMKVIRFRSPENVAEEIQYLQKRYDCHHFRFVDDSFTIKKSRLFKICSLFEPLNIHFRTQTRSDLLTPEMCEALKRAGCDELGLGVETADDKVLKLINKGETVEDHKRAVLMTKESGLRVKTNWMTGLPGETWETIEKNKQFIRETKPDRWILNQFCPFPGCDVWRAPEKYGVRILDKDWSKYYNFTESFIETDVASNAELNAHFADFNKFLRSEEWRK